MQMTTRVVKSNKIVTTVTIETDRFVNYDDILNSVSINPDDCYDEKPWEYCDGWEHTTRQLGYDDHDGLKDSRGYARCNRNTGLLIEIDDVTITDLWGYNGASKQVKAELIAQCKREALDQLVTWYRYRWEYYSVGGNYGGYADIIGGIDSYEYAEKLRYEIADEIAAQMESDGYVVKNRHNPHEQTHLQDLKDRLDRNNSLYVVHSR